MMRDYYAKRKAGLVGNSKQCAVDGCEQPHRAKGLCSTHYNQQMPGRHRKVEVICEGCGSVVVKQKSNRYRVTCSLDCWYKITFGGERPEKPRRELVGPVRFAKPTTAPVVEVPGRRGFVGVVCDWCGESFLHDLSVTGSVSVCCSKKCSRKASSARRDIVRGRFGITKVRRMAIYERDGWVCQLCHEPVDRTLHWSDNMAPSLDHIECQSWALIPDHSDENLRLAHRLCNALRGDRPAAA